MLNSVGAYLKFFSSAILDFVFPPRCFGCDKEIDKGLICDKCLTQVTTGALGTCPVCGLPKSDNEECIHQLFLSGVRPHTLARIRALGKYAPPYFGLIHNFKYQQKKKIGKILGLALANLVNSDPVLSRARYIIPIPLHPARLRERGYNQSLILAQEASFCSGITLLDCLKRIKYTKSQTQLDYQHRMKNIRDAYKLKSEYTGLIKDSRVILIDDVITTGATLSEAAKTLKENGAGDIYGAVVTAAQV
ncbi:MAG: ComF family protein [Candidatus Latescibacteria bacterium]|nr:ComF family protein [Candidatus Latescibacterota bacterium]